MCKNSSEGESLKQNNRNVEIALIKMDILCDQQLMKKNGEVVEANHVLRDKKVICFYFSANWCPPCREFTPILADFYAVKSFKYSILDFNFILNFL